jgi:hypothetical protein
MTEKEKEKKIEILLSLLQDTQETIRFIDGKVGVLVILLTGIIALYVSELSSIIEYFNSYSVFLLMFFIVNTIGIIVCFYYVARVIFPIKNPQSKIPTPYRNYPNIYQATLDKKGLIVLDFDDTLRNINKQSQTLEFEYLKISLIRNLKNARLKRLFIAIILTALLMIGQFAIQKIEGKSITIREGKCCCVK